MSLSKRIKSLFAVVSIAVSTLFMGLMAPVALAQDPVPVTAATAQVSNPYGVDALWRQGDFVAKTVLVLMLIMSAATWYIMFVKLYEQQKLFGQSKDTSAKFWNTPAVSQGQAALQAGTPFWYIADRALLATKHYEGNVVQEVDRSSWISISINQAVEEISSRLQGGLSVLATVGSTAPFVGLFGTVWGIYHALTAIGISGQASIDKVAGPVGEALIMTAIGLAVAVPAVMGYNWLVRRNKAAMGRVRSFSTDLHAALISGARVSDTSSVSQRKAA